MAGVGSWPASPTQPSDFNEKKGPQAATTQDMDGATWAQVAPFVLNEKKTYICKENVAPSPHDLRYGATWAKVAPYRGSRGAGGFFSYENKLGQTLQGGFGMEGLRWDGWGGVVWLLASLARPSHSDFY